MTSFPLTSLRPVGPPTTSSAMLVLLPDSAKNTMVFFITIISWIYITKAYNIRGKITLPAAKPQMTRIADYNDAVMRILTVLPL